MIRAREEGNEDGGGGRKLKRKKRSKMKRRKEERGVLRCALKTGRKDESYKRKQGKEERLFSCESKGKKYRKEEGRRGGLR